MTGKISALAEHVQIFYPPTAAHMALLLSILQVFNGEQPPVNPSTSTSVTETKPYFPHQLFFAVFRVSLTPNTRHIPGISSGLISGECLRKSIFGARTGSRVALCLDFDVDKADLEDWAKGSQMDYII
ncbi:hypothetical protein BT96DRAFT_988006 [Gymnopus androsaceus JB14]|uniref:Uncharacterized protein n=1 Tax=Gymnopus androsaceus JB14 TaxID=1447944 RepID=A0A6A4I863_9AGAR|nr:hypothetical protein BT96DRAFT_988006 [Gymnopus androsaceus JB14]